jgi:hypothetical protein
MQYSIRLSFRHVHHDNHVAFKPQLFICPRGLSKPVLPPLTAASTLPTLGLEQVYSSAYGMAQTVRRSGLHHQCFEGVGG